MNVGAAKSAGIRPFSVALVHVRTSCTQREISHIVSLKNGLLPIRQWVSYVEPAHIRQTDYFSPRQALRQAFEPNSGRDIELTARGDRFILGGSPVWLFHIFHKTLKVNLARFTDLEFHLPLDLIGSMNFPDFLKIDYARSPNNHFSQILDNLRAEREYGSEIRFDGEFLLSNHGIHRPPFVYLHWYSSTEKMLDFVLPPAGTKND